jgi:MFS family permease
MVDTGNSVAKPADLSQISSLRVWIIVGLLTTAYLLSFVDRQILALMIEPIKHDLQIDDLRFSFLTGLAFSVFFAVAGVPLGWASDTFARNRVIAGGVLCWSIATIGSGLAGSYGQIFVARILVGVGEAALTPAAYSLLADVVAPGMLGRAIAIFSMGSQFGSATAYIAGGAAIAELNRKGISLPGLDGHAVWQQIFVLVGLPGLLLAPLVLWAVRDPRQAASVKRLGIGAALRSSPELRPFMLCHFAGFTASAAAFFAISAWLPAVLGRRLHLDPAHLGLTAGLLVLLCCPLGTLTAGWIVDRMGTAYGSRAPFRAALFGMAGMLISMLIAGLVGGGPLLVAGLAGALFFAPWPLVLASLALQQAIPARLRAQVTALFLLVANLIGQTGGVSLVAVVTEKFWGDPVMIHRSLAMVCAAAAVLAFWPITRAQRLKGSN